MRETERFIFSERNDESVTCNKKINTLQKVKLFLQQYFEKGKTISPFNLHISDV